MRHVEDHFVTAHFSVVDHLAEDTHHSDVVHASSLDGDVVLGRVREQGNLSLVLRNLVVVDVHLNHLGFAVVIDSHDTDRQGHCRIAFQTVDDERETARFEGTSQLTIDVELIGDDAFRFIPFNEDGFAIFRIVLVVTIEVGHRSAILNNFRLCADRATH